VSTDAGRAASEVPATPVGKEADVAPPNADVAEIVAPEAPAVDQEIQESPVTSAAEADQDIAAEAPSAVVEADVTAESEES
jgi:hypothetical protein